MKLENHCKKILLIVINLIKKMITLTFDQFIQYGIEHGGNVVNELSWSFDFFGFPVTHENDDCYLISLHSGDTIRFNRYETIHVDPVNYPKHITIFSFGNIKQYYL